MFINIAIGQHRNQQKVFIDAHNCWPAATSRHDEYKPMTSWQVMGDLGRAKLFLWF